MRNRAERLLPFEVTVCGLAELDSYAAHGVSHVLSICDPHLTERPSFAAFGAHRRLELCFHDILDPCEGQVAPQQSHVDDILRFADELMAESPPDAHVLVHCHMGISRSSAALAVLLARVRPDLPAPQILAEVLRIRQHAWPNLRLIELGDAALGRNRELIAAVSAVYRRQLQCPPGAPTVLYRGWPPARGRPCGSWPLKQRGLQTLRDTVDNVSCSTHCFHHTPTIDPPPPAPAGEGGGEKGGERRMRACGSRKECRLMSLVVAPARPPHRGPALCLRCQRRGSGRPAYRDLRRGADGADRGHAHAGLSSAPADAAAFLSSIPERPTRRYSMQALPLTAEEQHALIELLDREIPALREAILQAADDHAYRDRLRERERHLTAVLSKLQEQS
jgi:predicted protein tyrosine phosphatase